MSRRNSHVDERERRSPPPHSNPNVFDDEYALDPDDVDFLPISDGFRPVGVSRDETWNGHHQDHDRSSSPRPPVPSRQSQDGHLRRLASRNSVVKTTPARESTSHDPRNPSTHQSRGTGSQTTPPLQRHTSISSTASFATTAHSDTALGAGPSHPYYMYPQNTVARTSSVTTSSTQRPPRRSASLQGPTHPYGMYPQNVVEDEPPVPQVQSAIPVGFPGLNSGYHRRIGPDGEEQDIIGPDGHTEQLPPYSRYPEEGPTKAALAAEASFAPVIATARGPNASDDALLSSPISPLSPTASLTPPRQEAQGSTSIPPLHPGSASIATLSTTELSAGEKQEVPKTQHWRNRKLWGRIPMTVVCLFFILLFVFGIILGAAIGTLAAKNRHKGGGQGRKDGKGRDDPSPQVTGTSNSLFDATPIPMPTSLSSLPTGPYALPLGIAQESSKNCLSVANQLSAWSCKMSFVPLVLTVTYQDEQSLPKASLKGLDKPDKSVQYGIQAPELASETMQLVLDLDFKVYGPAYHFADRYDKVVVLFEDDFTAGAALAPAVVKRDKPPFKNRFQAMPGDYPWYCFWNETYIEGYIYAEDNSTAATFTGFPTAWPPSPYGSSLPVETGVVAATPAENPPPPAETAPPPPPPAHLSRRKDGKDGDFPGDFPRYAPYPRIVKIEERRLPGSPQPYCQKMRLLDNGSVVQALDEAGTPIKVYLQENNPSIEEFLAQDQATPEPTATASSTPVANASEQRRRLVDLEKRGDPTDACHCQWMFQ